MAADNRIRTADKSTALQEMKEAVFFAQSKQKKGNTF